MKENIIDPAKLNVPAASLQAATQRQIDGYILHFLKELPSWCILAILIGIFLFYYNLSQADFIPRIIDGLVGGLLTSLIGAARSALKGSSQHTDIKAENIEKANTESGDVVASPGSKVTKIEKEI